MPTLAKYIKKFSSLRTAKLSGNRSAPHKPVLLLALMTEIESGRITSNQIKITPELVAGFKNYWYKLNVDTSFSPNFALPFFHLRSDGFWQLHTCLGKEILLTSSHSIRSFSQLKEAVDFATLNEELFELMSNQKTRDILRFTLIRRYFPLAPIPTKQNQIIESIIWQILHEPAASYRRRAATFDEEEVFIRGGVFKKEIPKIYNYSCCISGMRIVMDQSIQMIDACHIIPFSESGDDTISNGISLCPNLHRAFDRGLISINDNYSVIVKHFQEAANLYSIRQFEGRKILLPENKIFYPSIENIRSHRMRFNFQ